MHNRSSLRRSATILTTLVLSLTVAACGNDNDPGRSPAAAQTAPNGDVFNGADVAFATAMIPHHAQAIEMVTLTDGRALDPAVKELADQIRDAQAPEVEKMVGWLNDWGVEVPETSLDHSNAGHGMEGMDMGDNDMPGMMSEAEMTELKSASGEEFQDLWLEMMAEHHRGAIEMAAAEEADGAFPGALALAKSIQRSQEAEIQRIEDLRHG